MKRLAFLFAFAMAACCPVAEAVTRVPTLDIRHVAIDLRFDWPARQAIGTTTLTVSPRRASDRITLDAGMLAIESVTLAGGRALRFDYDGGDRDDGLAITLDRIYKPGQTVTIRIAYRTRWANHSDPNNLWGSNGRGLRFFSPTASEPRQRRQVWASGKPGSNRYWFPGYDAPNQLRSSELNITVPKPLTAVAGGRLVKRVDNADDTRSFHWKTERPEPNQRTTFAVGEFIDVPQRHGRMALHNLGYPDETDGVAASVVQLPDALRFFTELIGRPFPHRRYTQVFVQDLPWNTVGSAFAVQTENMVDDEGTHADFQYLWDGLQSESLVQQWFGGLVPICDWRHAWLERGFAHHLAALYTEHRHGRDEYLLWYVLADQAATLADGAQGNNDAVVEAAPKDLAAFVTGNPPYARGAAVLHMLRQQLGDARWRQVIRHYVRHNAGKPTCSDALQRSVEVVAGKPMAWFFEQWVHRGGHPVFEVHKAFDAAARRLELRIAQLQPAPLFQGPIDIQIDQRTERVWLEPQALNVVHVAAPSEPRLVQFDPGSMWIKELRFAKPLPELLHELRESRDPMSRHTAMLELVKLAKDPALPAAQRQQILSALAQLASTKAYWRVRFNALQQLGTLLAPTDPAKPAELDETLRQQLLTIIRDERSWLRTAAIRVLGLTRDPGYAALYRSHLADRSDRVVNAAAIALGRSGSPQAFDALIALPAKPSWKNQSLISALAGLKELGDPRGAELALKSLADIHSARWTLATPVWDFRLAAAQTLAALGRGEAAFAMVRERFERALAEGEVNHLFSNVQLMVTLADARAQQVFPVLRQRFAGDANALKAVDAFESQLHAGLKAR